MSLASFTIEELASLDCVWAKLQARGMDFDANRDAIDAELRRRVREECPRIRDERALLAQIRDAWDFFGVPTVPSTYCRAFWEGNHVR